MPKRKLTAKRNRVSEQGIERLREMIRSGAPWRKDGDHPPGHLDLRGLITGHFFDFGLKEPLNNCIGSTAAGLSRFFRNKLRIREFRSDYISVPWLISDISFAAIDFR